MKEMLSQLERDLPLVKKILNLIRLKISLFREKKATAQEIYSYVEGVADVVMLLKNTGVVSSEDIEVIKKELKELGCS